MRPEHKYPERSCRIFFTGTTALAGFFGILLFCLPQRAFSENENRCLTTIQPASISRFLDTSMQENLTDSANDQFFGRDFWVKAATRLQRAAGLSDIGGVYLGAEGYYFERVLDSHLSARRYADNLRCIEKFAAEQKAGTVFLPVPSAGTVLTGYLPAHAVMYDAGRLYRQAEEQLQQAGILDIRPELARRSADSQVYFKTDHHWTMEGAYAAYCAWCSMHKTAAEPLAHFKPKCASGAFFGTLYSKAPDFGAQPDKLVIPAELPQADVKIGSEKADGIYDWQKLETKDKYGVYFGGNFGRIDIFTHLKAEPAGSGTKKLLIIKDSFANSLVPFLMEDYHEIIMLDLRYYSGSVAELLREEQPDEALILYELGSFARDVNFFKLLK